MITAIAAGWLPVLAATSKKSTSSGGSYTFLIVLALFAVVAYFLFLRPQRQKARKQREAQSDIKVGDEVLTVGGIVGRVVEIDDQRGTIVSGADTVGFPAAGSEPARLVFVRNGISRKTDTAAAPTSSSNGAGHVDLDAPDDDEADDEYEYDEREDGQYDDELEDDELEDDEDEEDEEDEDGDYSYDDDEEDEDPDEDDDEDEDEEEDEEYDDDDEEEEDDLGYYTRPLKRPLRHVTFS